MEKWVFFFLLQQYDFHCINPIVVVYIHIFWTFLIGILFPTGISDWNSELWSELRLQVVTRKTEAYPKLSKDLIEKIKKVVLKEWRFLYK